MPRWTRYKTIEMVICCLLILLACALARGEVVDPESDRWQLENAEVTEHLGRKCLMGTAWLEDVDFSNGVIEVDMAVTGATSYPGIVFRRRSPGDYERFYVRPHISGRPDSLQYTPVINGLAGWQLYNGEGFTAAAEIPVDRWFTVRMEVKGTQARFFLDGAETPALVVTDLKHGDSRGPVGVFGPRDRTAFFSNFRCTADDTLAFDPPPEPVHPPGLITEWELSRSYDLRYVDMEKTPEAQDLYDLGWRFVESEPGGLVDVARHMPRSGVADVVFARKVITAGDDEVRNFRFGYSDAISIFFNGDLVFFGNSGYHQRDPSFLGIVGLNDEVYLHLKKGSNELLIAVAEQFGGWGFIFQDGTAVIRHPELNKLWELAQKFSFPESVVYDEQRDLLYVSNYFNRGREFISRMKTDGEIVDLEWITGLNRPTGLCLHGDRLWAVDRAALVEIDPEAGEVVNRHTVPGARFINDVAFDDDGNAYVSDTEGSVIHRLSGGEFEVWLEGTEITNPNGLCVVGGELIVGTSGDGCLKAVRLADKRIRTITCLGDGSIMDGVKPDEYGNLIISDFNGRVFQVTPAGEKIVLLNTMAKKRFCADLEYIAGERLLIIPTLYDNRIMAYKLGD